jgi:hypothetical protein
MAALDEIGSHFAITIGSFGGRQHGKIQWTKLKHRCENNFFKKTRKSKNEESISLIHL